jgi:uncharacterized membrane protein YdbT with pleckstrin-like domain
MGYIENNLISGESVTYRARLHWIVLVKPAFISLLLILVAALLFYMRSREPDELAMLVWIGGGLLIASVIPIGIAEMKRRAAEFGVTNKRVILKIGAVTSKTAEMFLNKIESVSVEQTLVGRIAGYGSITIRGTGGSLEPFHLISGPLEFRKQIQEQIGRTSEPTPRTMANG